MSHRRHENDSIHNENFVTSRGSIYSKKSTSFSNNSSFFNNKSFQLSYEHPEISHLTISNQMQLLLIPQEPQQLKKGAELPQIQHLTAVKQPKYVEEENIEVSKQNLKRPQTKLEARRMTEGQKKSLLNYGLVKGRLKEVRSCLLEPHFSKVVRLSGISEKTDISQSPHSILLYSRSSTDISDQE